MRSLILSVFAAAALFGAASNNVAEASIDPKRVHVVDSFNVTGGKTYFFRGNSPYNKDTKSVEYDLWVQTMANAANQTGIILPPAERLYLVDVCLENIFDKGFFEEQQFFTENPTKGSFLNWELLGAPLWPTAFTDAQVQEMIASGSVWKNDQLPTRMVEFRNMLQYTTVPAGYDAIAYYAHCAAGCDRTGEFVAAYRMAFDIPQSADTAKDVIGPVFQKNCDECGRCPNYYSAGATGWFCMTLNHFNRSASTQLTDCFTAFNCKPLGDCTATGI